MGAVASLHNAGRDYADKGQPKTELVEVQVGCTGNVRIMMSRQDQAVWLSQLKLGGPTVGRRAFWPIDRASLRSGGCQSG